jgi:hypothetical protein
MDLTNRTDGQAGIPASEVIQPQITKERLLDLSHTLEEYKRGKNTLERRIIDAEQMWKLRHWEQIRKKDVGDPEPTSAWLVNAILSKHSDAMDAYPQPICLPREEGDKAEAKMLSSVLPVVLQQNEFEQTWSDVWWYKLKAGTGVYGVFWDTSKLGGLGDITVRKIDILNLFWEPGITDIQNSRYLFHVELVDDDLLAQQYPQLADKLKGDKAVVSRYVYDEAIDTTGKSAVIDVYYKIQRGGKTILHYIKYVGETLLFSTEGNPDYADRGIYAHGRYPFVFDALFPEEGYPNCGYGYVDLCKDPQKFIDVMNNCFIKNTVVAATPRWFVRADGGINETEYADMTKPFVHVTGSINQDSISQIVQQPLSDIYVSLMQLKIDELKQTSGNRDVNNGSTSAGVTAASAIAALQEAGNGLSRDMIAASYRAYREVIDLCIELIREFYDAPRTFRILGDRGTMEFITYSNHGLQPQALGMDFGVDMGYRLPVFDIEVEAQKESSYTIATYNELAVQLFQLGVFNPQMTDQALMMLDMMDFKGKDALVQKIQQNGTIYQMLTQYMQLALTLAAKYEPALVAGLSQQITGTMGGIHTGAGVAGSSFGGGISAMGDQATGAPKQEHAFVSKARQTAQDSARPR